MLIPLIVIALARIEELAAIAFGRKPQRLIGAPPLVPEIISPKVSIHIPAYREPPEMLIQTLDAVSRLNYPNFECIVVMNNTPDTTRGNRSGPIAAHWASASSSCALTTSQGLQGRRAALGDRAHRGRC